MDERFLKEEGLDVFTGNELILKGGLESGMGLLTGYPGSPVSDVFDVASSISALLKKHGILAEMANNEALSVARLNGSRMAGVRAMAVMKSVGLNVASDGLALGNLSEPRNGGGSLVVVGDALVYADGPERRRMIDEVVAHMGRNGISAEEATGHLAQWAEEDVYVALPDELALMADAGFPRPDCFWRHGFVAVYGAFADG